MQWLVQQRVCAAILRFVPAAVTLLLITVHIEQTSALGFDCATLNVSACLASTECYVCVNMSYVYAAPTCVPINVDCGACQQWSVLNNSYQCPESALCQRCSSTGRCVSPWYSGCEACSVFTAETSCAAHGPATLAFGSCSWCSISGQCTDSRFETCQCSSLRTPNCSSSTDASSCKTCSMTNKCVPRNDTCYDSCEASYNATGHCFIPLTCEFCFATMRCQQVGAPCLSCRSIASHSNCSATPGCQWCAASSYCQANYYSCPVPMNIAAVDVDTSGGFSLGSFFLVILIGVLVMGFIMLCLTRRRQRLNAAAAGTAYAIPVSGSGYRRAPAYALDEGIMHEGTIVEAQPVDYRRQAAMGTTTGGEHRVVQGVAVDASLIGGGGMSSGAPPPPIHSATVVAATPYFPAAQ